MKRDLFSILHRLPKSYPDIKEGEMLLGYYERRGLSKLGYEWHRIDARVYNEAGLLMEQRLHEKAMLVAVIVHEHEYEMIQARQGIPNIVTERRLGWAEA